MHEVKGDKDEVELVWRTALYKDQKIPIKTFNSIKQEFLAFLYTSYNKDIFRNTKKNWIQGILYMGYFKIDTSLKIISLHTDNNLNKHSVATFTLNITSLSVFAHAQ